MFGTLVGKIKFDHYGDIITQVNDMNIAISKIKFLNEDLNGAH